MTMCESCEQEKPEDEIVDIEGQLLCKECSEEIIRCDNCKKLLSLSYDDLTDNLGRLSCPELFLPNRQTSLMFCDRDCLVEYLENNKDDTD